MITLSYSACYDPYNTVFRMLATLLSAPQHTMNAEVLRIGDFFVCFPMRVDEVKPPNSVKGMRKRCNTVIRAQKESQFEVLPNSQTLFERMKVIQETALSAMLANGFVNVVEEEGSRIVRLNEDSLSLALREKINAFVEQNRTLFEVVGIDFSQIILRGENGLKARTGLGAFEYDTV